MTMIVSLRGTGGSGKSTVVHTALKRWRSEVVEYLPLKRGRRPLVYLVWAPEPFFVLGSYETVCGGCDTITNYAEVVPVLLKRYAPHANLLFEGLLVSHTFGRIGELMQQMGRQHEIVFAFLDTPLAVCLARIQGRRTERGDDRPVNPKHTTIKHEYMPKLMRKLDSMGLPTIEIHHCYAFEEVMCILGN